MSKAIQVSQSGLPIIALIGRPNVGKSTLFNRLTRSRDALVADFPGLTRDRQFGRGQLCSNNYIVVDTGGLNFESDGVDALMAEQTQRAINEADYLLFLVDAKQGLNSDDEKIASYLRKQSKPCSLIVNKVDGFDPLLVCAEFYQLGLGEPIAIAASQGRNVRSLIESILQSLGIEEQHEDLSADLELNKKHPIRIAIVGRPNVGKSTLVNRLIGETRVVAYDQPGTTRDSIEVPFTAQGKQYVLIDTAGMRKRARVTEVVEKFSAIKAIQAIEGADVVILVMDARTDIVDQDISLLAYALDAGRSVIIVINKWDGLSHEQKQTVKLTIDRRLEFINYAEKRFISALHGSGVGELLDLVNQAYASATSDIKTSVLTSLLEQATQAHPPPLINGRRIKLRYVHQGGRRPPLLIIHGNQTGKVPAIYTRYLVNFFRKQLRLVGTPLQIEYKSSSNPYESKHNVLTERQKKQRKRLIKHVKRNAKKH